jgi:hypothetical protein
MRNALQLPVGLSSGYWTSVRDMVSTGTMLTQRPGFAGSGRTRKKQGLPLSASKRTLQLAIIIGSEPGFASRVVR